MANSDGAEREGDTDETDDADGDDAETDSGEPSDEDGGEEEQTGLPLPFGIGTREAFGSSLLVGATYVLGHWI